MQLVSFMLLILDSLLALRQLDSKLMHAHTQAHKPHTPLLLLKIVHKYLKDKSIQT